MRVHLLVFVVLSLQIFGACGQACDVRVSACQPDCKTDEVCDAETNTCRPRRCTEDSDCGPPRYYECDWGPMGVDTVKICKALGCREDRDCDDNLFCNGAERCSPLSTAADSQGCIPPAFAPCAAAQTCDELRDRCVVPCSVPEDADGDGVISAECGGTDCDDSSAARYPGNVEVCDALDVDEDCDPSTYGTRDQDGDGAIDSACCNGAGATARCGTDCDDLKSGVHPLSSEVCNGLDDDCDFAIDEGVRLSGYLDADRDGYGQVDGGAVQLCPHELQNGYSVYANDCNDSNPAITPGTFTCVGGQFPTQVTICTSNGTWMSAACAAQQTCVTQPTGVGICR